MAKDRFMLSDQEIEKLKKLLDALIEKEINKPDFDISIIDIANEENKKLKLS